MVDGQTATHRFDSIRSSLGRAVNDHIGSVFVQEDLDGVVVLQVELCNDAMQPLLFISKEQLLDIMQERPCTLTRSLLTREYAVPLTAHQ